MDVERRPGAGHRDVQRLAALDVDIACFGHGQPLAGGAGAQLARVAATL